MRGHADHRKWVTPCQPVPDCWLTQSKSLSAWSFHPSILHMVPRNIGSSSCLPKNATFLIGLPDQDDTCHEPPFLSHSASGTRSHRRSDSQVFLAPTVADLQVTKASPLTPTTEVSCPITITGVRSSSVAQHLDCATFSLGFHPSVSSREQFQAACRTSCKKTSATSSPRRAVSPCADWTSRLSARSCKLGNSTSSAVLGVSWRCGNIATHRTCSTAASTLTP